MQHTQAYGSKFARANVGTLIIAIGVLHQLVGVLFGTGVIAATAEGATATPLLDMAREGLVGAVEPHPQRMIFFWFMMTGFAMLTIGWLARLLERRDSLPRAFSLVFGGFSLAGALLIPVSGFWLGLVPAFLAWRRSPH